MVFRSGEILIIPALLLCSLTVACAFSFPDFNFYVEASTTMDKACYLFSTMLEWIAPSEPQIENVLFQLRSPCDRIEYGVSEADVLSTLPQFDDNLKTVVLVTGWNSDLDESYTKGLTEAYLCRGGYNLIVVNTSSYIRTEYIKSAYNTEKLGQFVALGLELLEIPGKDIHLIGHSLGAHIMGSAGRHFAAATGDTIGRITGLDPARPCFEATPVFSRLSADDATFVDVIHSNPGETGLEEPIGHADFYPEGLQPTKPGCSSFNVKCSHIRSINYYIESVYHGNEMNFIASKCFNYTNLETIDCHGSRTPVGYAADENARGIYLLAVNDEAPFGMNAKDDDYLKLSGCGDCTE